MNTRIIAGLSAVLLFLALPAAAREPSAEELGEFQGAIDAGDLDRTGEIRAQLFFDEIEGTAVDVQTMRLQYFKKDYDAAYGLAERVLAADPRNTAALNVRGLVKIERNDAAGALADYDRGFAWVGQEPPPKRGRPMALRGVIKLERGDVAGATADFDTAIANDPNDPVGWYWRGELWMRSGDHDKAISAYQSALKILPDDKTYQAALAKAQAAK